MLSPGCGAQLLATGNYVLLIGHCNFRDHARLLNLIDGIGTAWIMAPTGILTLLVPRTRFGLERIHRAMLAVDPARALKFGQPSPHELVIELAGDAVTGRVYDGFLEYLASLMPEDNIT